MAKPMIETMFDDGSKVSVYEEGADTYRVIYQDDLGAVDYWPNLTKREAFETYLQNVNSVAFEASFVTEVIREVA
jgi:uncharacterized protein (DUF2236 family)